MDGCCSKLSKHFVETEFIKSQFGNSSVCSLKSYKLLKSDFPPLF